MEPKLIDRSNFKNQSFSVTDLDGKNFFKVWHYHPELELVVILESTGTQFVGDSIEQFEPGDVLLIGENLPHLLLNDGEYFEEGSTLSAKAIVINFNRHFTGHTFLNLPEMKAIDELLDKGKRGVKFSGVTKQAAKDASVKLLSLTNFDRMMAFIQLLEMLARSSEYELLANAGYSNSTDILGNNRMGRIYAYVMNNFDKNISLKEAADIANMNPTAFSRYFKKNNNKNFTQYINEVRIGFACKLLLQRKYNISEICYRSGFNNVSNFNRQFRIINGMSPKGYINSYNFDA